MFFPLSPDTLAACGLLQSRLLRPILSWAWEGAGLVTPGSLCAAGQGPETGFPVRRMAGPDGRWPARSLPVACLPGAIFLPALVKGLHMSPSCPSDSSTSRTASGQSMPGRSCDCRRYRETGGNVKSTWDLHESKRGWQLVSKRGCGVEVVAEVPPWTHSCMPTCVQSVPMPSPGGLEGASSAGARQDPCPGPRTSDWPLCVHSSSSAQGGGWLCSHSPFLLVIQ